MDLTKFTDNYKYEPEFIFRFCDIEMKNNINAKGFRLLYEYARSFYLNKEMIQHLKTESVYRQILALDPPLQLGERRNGTIDVFTWLCFTLYCELKQDPLTRGYYEKAIALFHTRTEQLRILYKAYLTFLIRKNYEYNYLIQVYGEAIYAVPTFSEINYFDLDPTMSLTTRRTNFSFHYDVTLQLAACLPGQSSFDFLQRVVSIELLKSSELIYCKYLEVMHTFKRVGCIYKTRFPFSLCIWQMLLKLMSYGDIKQRMFFDHIFRGSLSENFCIKRAYEYGLKLTL